MSPVPAHGGETPPEISSLAAVLLDARTGTILYEKNGSVPHPPASLTKVMTIHLLLEKIAAGELTLEDEVPLPPESWASNLPRDSSLMFLGPDQRPRVLDILQGLAVSSGNDAAVAAAHLTAGSVEDFALLMNAEARRLGFADMYFIEPSGYDANNRITAVAFARFLKFYLDRHPNALENLHSLREFTYPREENLLPGNGSNPITQYNRNNLLFTYPGVDGIKTGYLHESGYNIAVTAGRNEMRLILVLLGAYGATPLQGVRSRSRDSEVLLNYGFDNFSTRKTRSPEPEPVHVWKGRIRSMVPRVPEEIWVTVPRGEENRIRGEIVQDLYITAPVMEGSVLGKVRITLDDKTLYQADLTAPAAVPKGPWWRVLFDGFAIFFRNLLGYPTD